MVFSPAQLKTGVVAQLCGQNSDSETVERHPSVRVVSCGNKSRMLVDLCGSQNRCPRKGVFSDEATAQPDFLVGLLGKLQTRRSYHKKRVTSTHSS